MQNNYQFKPRGIVKWHAFSAVISGNEQKESAHIDEIIDIDLFEDKLALLNQILLNALENDEILIIEYLEDNTLKNIESKIIKIDYPNNTIIFEDLSLNVLQIANLTAT